MIACLLHPPARALCAYLSDPNRLIIIFARFLPSRSLVVSALSLRSAGLNIFCPTDRWRRLRATFVCVHGLRNHGNPGKECRRGAMLKRWLLGAGRGLDRARHPSRPALGRHGGECLARGTTQTTRLNQHPSIARKLHFVRIECAI